LKDKHVDAVVDVGRYPGSREYPQFNKEQMIMELKKENLSYIHIEKLGGRRKQSDTKRSRYDDSNSGWKNEGFKAYADNAINVMENAKRASLKETTYSTLI